MRTIIFATAIRYLTPLFLIFSLYILLRGHNHPGGGFIGGLIGSIAFVFHVLAHGSDRTVNAYFRVKLYSKGKPDDDTPPEHMWRLLSANTWNRLPNYPQPEWRYHIVRLRPAYVMAIGLFLAASSGLLGLFQGMPFMTSWWMEAEIPIIGALGTPLLFDAGVYLLVLGMVLKMIFTMSKE
ncbi:MnhB domain-containing protein [Pontibacter chinhatensis]|uniref:Multicomponent Na+:H+ antiporter subunit B n=1 Tax=Pontibacter chinhatensis TaxID=1436961 RepID=A0A1I2MJ19_9BACT|nr:MnhB domain-containing protein [Pontibacter chinhatensis]SFF89547.1 multicomponent Na+:H+ antiporter subunit B [Pontibacter chinhatensis]